MMELIGKMQILFYFAGAAIIFGIVVKMIVGISLKRLVSAASNMNKSNHALMRLVRAKFEHACMISDKVQNVQAFVEKYLYEYKVLGISLDSWRQLEKTAIWLCGLPALAGVILSYLNEEDMQVVQSYGVIGGAGVLLLLLFQVMGNEKGKLAAVKMYMVDFLENTYAHRYERIGKRENLAAMERENEVVVQPKEDEEDEVLPVREPEPRPGVSPIPPVIPPVPQVDPELQPVQAAKIREILEEFLM